ncbi:hypothetical protein Tco_0411980 [Tanacetum coccineum]
MDYQCTQPSEIEICRQAEEIERQREIKERNRVHEETMQMLREMIKIQEEKRIYEEAARQEEEKRIAKEKEAADLSPSPILIEDSDSHMEEIDLFLAFDDSMPSGIEIDDYDSEGDIRFLEELLNSDSPPLPENESFSLDHFDDPSLPRPPPEPPDDSSNHEEPCSLSIPNSSSLRSLLILDPKS